ncbi:MAG TPA: D-alanine--D-alanine ligase, partial [Bacillota bacterium]|nr:D-alanine--D-alanine ligase [Bacillota bacterium]
MKQTNVVSHPLRITLVYNKKREDAGSTDDSNAEYDTPETIEAILTALRSNYEHVTALELDDELVENLKRERPDIVFNIAEGLRGRGREAEVPALLNVL